MKFTRHLRLYAFPLFLSSVFCLFGFLLNKYTGIGNPFLLFFLPVVLSAYRSGLKTGVLAVAFLTLALDFFFIPPYLSFRISDPSALFQLILFCLDGIFISFIIGKSKGSTDIKKHLKLENDLKKLLDEKSLKYLEAKKEIKARDEFLSIASHELKTPLTSMLLQVQSAVHNITHVSLAEFSVANLLKKLESVEVQTQRLSKMINDLLNVSLITTGRLDLELENVNLSSLVKDVLDRFTPKLTQKGYRLQLNIEKNVNGVWDQIRIEQVIVNLLTNAIKYGNGKPITVTLKRSGSSARLIVADRGIGIPDGSREKIFSLFERDVSSKDYQGLGVGLYIVRQIVTAHGGKIAVESREKEGSVFTVELPLKSPLKNTAYK